MFKSRGHFPIRCSFIFQAGVSRFFFFTIVIFPLGAGKLYNWNIFLSLLQLFYRRIPLASPGLIHAHFGDLVG